MPNDLSFILRELFERTRRTQSHTQNRKLTILRFEESAIDQLDLLDTETSPSLPTTAIWADIETWDRSNDNIFWSEGAVWR
jgi:hypothetical protein